MTAKLSVLVALAIAASGCHLSRPGVIGTIEFELELDYNEYGFINIVIHENTISTFDPTEAPNPPPSAPEFYQWHATVDIAFPFDYEFFVERIGGPTELRDWRVTAWLSDVNLPSGIGPSEPYGSTTFELNDCGLLFKGYCGVEEGVVVRLDRLSPFAN